MRKSLELHRMRKRSHLSSRSVKRIKPAHSLSHKWQRTDICHKNYHVSFLQKLVEPQIHLKKRLSVFRLAFRIEILLLGSFQYFCGWDIFLLYAYWVRIISGFRSKNLYIVADFSNSFWNENVVVYTSSRIPRDSGAVITKKRKAYRKTTK